MPPRGSKKAFEIPDKLAEAEISEDAKTLGLEPHQLGLFITSFDHIRLKELALLRNQSMTSVMQEIIGQMLDTTEHAEFIATEAALALQNEAERLTRRSNY